MSSLSTASCDRRMTWRVWARVIGEDRRRTDTIYGRIEQRPGRPCPGRGAQDRADPAELPFVAGHSGRCPEDPQQGAGGRAAATLAPGGPTRSKPAMRSTRNSVRRCGRTSRCRRKFSSPPRGRSVKPPGGKGSPNGWTRFSCITAATCRHMLTVAGHASSFGQYLSLHESDVAMLAEAALLHDVGKLFIPISVLEKTGELTEMERRAINTHSMRGASALVRGGRTAKEVIAAVRDHHEYLDGSGYPRGVGADGLGPLTRMITIADIYSALTEETPLQGGDDTAPVDHDHGRPQGQAGQSSVRTPSGPWFSIPSLQRSRRRCCQAAVDVPPVCKPEYILSMRLRKPRPKDLLILLPREEMRRARGRWGAGGIPCPSTVLVPGGAWNGLGRCVRSATSFGERGGGTGRLRRAARCRVPGRRSAVAARR